MNKFRNIKCEYNGIKFDSLAEMRRYQELLLMERAGEIGFMTVHPRYMLQESFKAHGKSYPAITYAPDFGYTECETGQRVAEDVKAWDQRRACFIETPVFKLKEKLFARRFPDIELRVIR